MKKINENKNKNKNHSRVSLSEIFNACRVCIMRKQRSVEDPRLQISGMAPLFDNRVRAFTLIELLVVVLIIGILAAIALPQYQAAVDKARYSSMMAAVRALKDAQEIYYLANGSYAAHLSDLDGIFPAECDEHQHCGNFSLNQAAGVYVYGYFNRDTVGIGNALLMYLGPESGRVECYSYKVDGARGKKLCKSMGGKLFGAEDAYCGEWLCSMYRLNF